MIEAPRQIRSSYAFIDHLGAPETLPHFCKSDRLL